MSKGYADYVIATSLEIDREIMRERDGVEVPLFGNEFEEWLKESEELSEGSVVNYMRWLHKADSWILATTSGHSSKKHGMQPTSKLQRLSARSMKIYYSLKNARQKKRAKRSMENQVRKSVTG